MLATHIRQPFIYHFQNETKTLTRDQKITSIAISIILGYYTMIVGGVFSFYLITAYFKNRHIKQLQTSFDKYIEMGFRKDQDPYKAVRLKSPSTSMSPPTDVSTSQTWTFDMD